VLLASHRNDVLEFGEGHGELLRVLFIQEVFLPPIEPGSIKTFR
jgi:hypothetical protein